MRIGMYLSPEQKAMAVMIAQGLSMSVKDLLMEGIMTVGMAKGYILPDGKIASEHDAEYQVALEMVKQSEVNS